MLLIHVHIHVHAWVGPSWSLVHGAWVGTPDCIYNTTVVAHITQRATAWGVVHTVYQ